MRNVKELQTLVTAIKNQGFEAWLDELTFFRIFFIWLSIIMIVGVFYHLASNGNGYLTDTPTQERVTAMSDAIYFSFITATTTGFGDITPHGSFKIVSILEAIFGFILLAFVTSKLIAIKQNTILTELYEISFNERINRLRSSFLLFRQDLTRIINKIEENTLHRRELAELHIYFAPLEDALSETFFLFQRATKSSFVKSVDPLNAELILHSIVSSLQKVSEVVEIINKKGAEAIQGETTASLGRCLLITDKIFDDIKVTEELDKAKMQDLVTQKNELVKVIRKNLKR